MNYKCKFVIVFAFNDLVIFDADPKRLVDRLIDMIKKQNSRVTFKAPNDDSKTFNETRG